MDYQKLIIVGRVVADAELKSAKEGEVKYARVRIAVNNLKEQAIFFPTTLFGELAEKLAPHLSKGRQVLVEGRIEVAENGLFSVIAERVKLGSKPNHAGENSSEVTPNNSLPEPH